MFVAFFLLYLVSFSRSQELDDDFDEFAIPTEKIITFTHDQVYDMAEVIMKTMDKAFESRNYTDLLNLLGPDIQFTVCQLQGTTVEGLKVYLEDNEVLKKVKKSQHDIIYYPQNDGVQIVDVHGFRFDYRKYFLLKENHMIRTGGTLIVRTQYGKIEIVRAIEYCPETIF